MTTFASTPPRRRRALPTAWEMLHLRIAARAARITRWEFWPSWMVYAPLIPYLGFLAAKHRSVRVCTYANPGIPLGGIIGESKWEILRLIPSEWIAPTVFVPPGPIEQRRAAVRDAVESNRWSWPIILKPDVGERGKGVAVIANIDAAEEYLHAHPGAILAQRRHPGPYEAGIFYYRLPNEPSGTVFSITDKKFARVLGDGVSTIRTLVWRHPRYRLQAKSFFVQLGSEADRVPAAGESVQIGAIGNHCRGTLFEDGEHLITEQLTRAVDAIAVRTQGFYFGRFDIRYSDPTELAAGKGFEIVELNGLLSESTNIYDPRMGFWDAQQILRRQWSLAFAIGAANARKLKHN